MTEILIAMATGLVINLVTWLSGKLGLSKTYVSVLLSLFIGVLLYIGQIIVDKYPLQWQEIVQFVAGAYAMSQVVYNIYQKLIEQKK